MTAAAPPRLLLAGAIVVALFVAPSTPAGILDVFSWGLDYVMDMPKLEKRDGEEDTGGRNCFCESSLTCICCMDFNLTFIDLGGPGCVRMKYFTEMESMAVNISYGDSVLHSEMVKGPNPDPTCMNIFSEWAQVCARFRDLAPADGGMKACLQFEPVLLGEVQTQYQVGCFQMGPTGIHFDAPVNAVSAPEVIPEGVTKVNQTYPGAAGSEDGLSEAELIAAVNETAEDGIAFFTELLGLNIGGGQPANSQNGTAENAEVPRPDSSSASEFLPMENVPQESSRKNQI